MLLLSRKADQKILINGGKIQITVKRINNDMVFLGIVAPKEIDIDREEIFVRKQQKRTLLQNIA